MPTSLTIAAGVTVGARPERVWDLAFDWSRQHEWIWATRTSGGHGLGAGVTGRTGIGPVGFTDTMEITQWDPPRRCTVTHTGTIVRGEGIFEGLPRGSRSEFRWTERIAHALDQETAPAGHNQSAGHQIGAETARVAQRLPDVAEKILENIAAHARAGINRGQDEQRLEHDGEVVPQIEPADRKSVV